jgi:pimeloyl-ACP methyl ester carboxylesterase
MLSDQRTSVSTPLLSIDYETIGDPSGPAVVLMHGFPYDVRAYDEVAEIVAAAGARVVVPYLRGFGRTRFLDDDTLRSGQQAALGQDLIDLLDALDIDQAVVAGYDWGGRAACIAAALFPDRVRGLVTVDGYNIQDIAHASTPAPPDWEKTYWYQYYFHSERGRLGLTENREALCELLWRDWSPTWADSPKALAANAPPHPPAPLRPRSGRPTVRRPRTAHRRGPEDRRADRGPRKWSGRGRRRKPGGGARVLHRTVHAPGAPRHRSQRPTGGSDDVRTRCALSARERA